MIFEQRLLTIMKSLEGDRCLNYAMKTQIFQSNFIGITAKEIILNKYVLCDLFVEGEESMISCVKRLQ